MTKRVPPHSIEAEQEVLGSILQHEEALDDTLSVLKEEDFYDPKHKLVYKAIVSLHSDSKPVDVTTTTNQLQRDNHLQKVGGRVFLASLLEFGLSKNVEPYTRIVHEKSQLRQLIEKFIQFAYECYDDKETADKIIDKMESAVMSMSIGKASDTCSHVKEIVPENLEDLDKILRGEKTYLRTHFKEWDKLTVGLTPSDLIILAGRPSMGKTALAMDVGRNVAEHGTPVGVFSIEMSKEQLTKRLQYGRARVSGKRAELGDITKEELDRITRASSEIAQLPIYIDDKPDVTVQYLRAQARRMVSRYNVGLIIVDYIQLINGTGNENRVEEMSKISRGLKLIAREVHVPVLALSQLSRAVEQRPNKRPQLSDLRDSGAIEQDADEVLFVFREEMYMKHIDDKDPKKQDVMGTAEVICDKNRDGEVGIFKLAFLKEYSRFENLQKDELL